MAATQENIKLLSSQRSKLKRKVTSHKNALQRASNLTSSDLQQLLTALQTCYSELVEVHLEFSELVESDEQFEELKIVNGLDLSQYMEAVDNSYREATDFFTKHNVKFLNESIARALDTVDRILATSSVNRNLVYTHIQACVKLSEQYLSECGQRHDAIHKAIIDMNCIDATSAQSYSNGVGQQALPTSQNLTSFPHDNVLLPPADIARATGDEHQGGAAPREANPRVIEGGTNCPPAVVVSVEGPSPLTSSLGLDSIAVGGHADARQSMLRSNVVPSLSHSSQVIATPSTSSLVNTQLPSGLFSSRLPVGSSTEIGFDRSNSKINIVSAYSDRSAPSLHPVDLSDIHIGVQSRVQTKATWQQSEFKKMPLPKFSGDPCDWPEFRAIWIRYLAHARQCGVDQVQLVYQFKQSLMGEAKERVSAIYATQAKPLEHMFEVLEGIYSDVGSSVQFSLSQLNGLESVKEGDYRGLIKLINAVEKCYSQLAEVGQLKAVNLTHVDDITDCLPFSITTLWMNRYQSMSVDERIHPFSQFMLFLSSQRDISQRYANRQAIKGRLGDKGAVKSRQEKLKQGSKCMQTETSVASDDQSSCIMHGESGHTTGSCKEFLDLSVSERYNRLRANKVCFRCFGNHLRSECTSKISCKKCKNTKHHTLLCSPKMQANVTVAEVNDADVKVSASGVSCAGITDQATNVVFAVKAAKVKGTFKFASLFFDSGSNSSFITKRAAKRLNARMTGSVTLYLATMGGKESEVEASQYEVELMTSDLSVVVVSAYCMDYITGPVGLLNLDVLNRLFPGFDVSVLQRQSCQVDILIGMDMEGLHPGEILAEAGPNLRVKASPFGPVLMGTHSVKLLMETVAPQINCHSLIGSHATVENRVSGVQSNLSRAISIPLDNFIQGEELGTAITPKCGACKCSRCPIAGNTYSFVEEQELMMIRDNLRYDKEGKRWITKYPWVIDPKALPDNLNAAMGTLRHTERVLSKDGDWAKVYNEQIKDMVDRGVAKILSQEDLDQWDGPVFYLSHLAVQNPKSTSTPVRIVFNSSQVFQGFSLNASLAKGPDSYLNNLLGVLLRWRENYVAVAADIRKMYNSIYIEELEQHCHRFLWRGMDLSRPPDVYSILRVNMGDKPAGAISAEAVYRTAEMFQEDYPRVSTLLKVSTYVDDIVDSVVDLEEAVSLAGDTNMVLEQAGFKVKHWLFTGDNGVRINPQDNPDSDGDTYITKILGVSWNPLSDIISFNPSLNFSPKRKGVYTRANLRPEEVPQSIPTVLTRRIVLEQVMKVYDPFGFLCPFTLISKILLRKTWAIQLDWDDSLSRDLHREWVEFFVTMFQLTSLKFDRCLSPEGKVGNPILIILSDGSDLAYGCSAYIRWSLADGSFWCRLVMAKCRIAPMRKISTPQMELNGAVLNKRIRKVLEKELRLTFERVYQLVDSETVLHMINKVSTRFRIYEGVRVGEVQQATNGDMSEWFWIPGIENISDWTTRVKFPSEIGAESSWVNGPSFLWLPESEWPVKVHAYKDLVLPGEKQVKISAVNIVQVGNESRMPFEFKKFGSARAVVYRVARLLNVARKRSWSGWLSKYIDASSLCAALELIVKILQDAMKEELGNKRGKYRQLCPQRDGQGIWVVGTRLARCNPMLGPLSDSPQMLLPSDDWFTHLLMRDAHEDCSHRGRDSTLARFRLKFWITKGNALAKKVVSSCHKCRREDPKLITQQMGLLPIDRLRPAPPFTSVMLDLFGPYSIRGEVQKRVRGKGYGVIFTDMFSRAVHIEGVFSYDTQAFLSSLARFTSIRGWPETIYSDCGSQIVAASNALKAVWDDLDHQEIVKQSAFHGSKWIFGPPDSPWHQGTIESLVKTAKRAIHFAVGDRCLSASEFLTVCSRIANVINERPIGRLPGSDSEINLFTPNCLLLGRAVADQPGGLEQRVSHADRLAVIESTLDDFWKLWVELYAPTMMSQNKWTQASRRDLCVGDVVVVTDSNSIRGRYYIAKVVEVFCGGDGKVRKVAIEYRNCAAGATSYSVSKPIKIIRAVQRLALLVPIEGEGNQMCKAKSNSTLSCQA